MDLSRFTSDGKFLMLALDHRGSFKKLMNPESPDLVSDEKVIQLKSEIINSLKDQFSGLLIDEEYGLKAYQNKTKSYLLPVEKTGYTDQNGERVTELEYSVEQLKSMGASGAKLLLYFNPNLESAKKQMETGKKVLDECKFLNFPFFLELVSYIFGKEDIREERAGLVIESVRSFVEFGVIPDIFKLEYPGSFDACVEVTRLVGDTPWILLTRGDSFDVFKPELQDAVKAGCIGFLAGRALWQEVCRTEGEEKKEFLEKTLPERFKEISEIVKASYLTSS